MVLCMCDGQRVRNDHVERVEAQNPYKLYENNVVSTLKWENRVFFR